MSSKLSNTSKNTVVTAVIVLAALLFKSFFSLSKTAIFQPTLIPYILICCIPLTIFIFSKLSPECGKDFKAVDIIALIGIAYTFFVVLDDSVIRNPVMITVGLLSIALVLSQSIYFLVKAMKRAKQLGISEDKECRVTFNCSTCNIDFTSLRNINRKIPAISAMGASVSGLKKTRMEPPDVSISIRRMICAVTVVPMLAPITILTA